MKILVAEDDNVSRTLLTRMLTALNHEVTAVADGAAAWEAYQKGHYHLVVSDWLMPGLDGLELVCRIRATRRDAYTWIILLTARDFDANFAATMTAGVDDYLTKPLNRDLLLVRIEVARRIIDMSGRIAFLESCIPICMSCRSVRDTTEQWCKLDQYLHQHTGVDFSHGYCPDCYFTHSLRPELERLRELVPLPAAGEADRAPAVAPASVHRLVRLDAVESPGLLEEVVSHLEYCANRMAATLEKRTGSARLSNAERSEFGVLASLCAEVGAVGLEQLVRTEDFSSLSGPELAHQVREETGHVLRALLAIKGRESVAA